MDKQKKPSKRGKIIRLEGCLGSPHGKHCGPCPGSRTQPGCERSTGDSQSVNAPGCPSHGSRAPLPPCDPAKTPREVPQLKLSAQAAAPCPVVGPLLQNCIPKLLQCTQLLMLLIQRMGWKGLLASARPTPRSAPASQGLKVSKYGLQQLQAWPSSWRPFCLLSVTELDLFDPRRGTSTPNQNSPGKCQPRGPGWMLTAIVS